MSLPTINNKQFVSDFDALRQFGLQPNGAIHRTAFSRDDLAARRWVADRLTQLGLSPTDDAAGNTIAVYAGIEDLPPIGIGSHTDTVPMGGAYDGALGVVAAIAVVEALQTAGKRLRHPIEVINFSAEEATMAGGTTGSQAMAGIFNLATLEKRAWDSKLVREHLLAAGLVPERLNDAKREKGSFAAFLELHIEQSKRLVSAETQIAVVDSFVGIRRYAVTFNGTANHAGTTPMAERADALVMSAPMIRFVQDMAVELDIVGTIGDFNVYPGAPNVIPELVEIVVEIRGSDAAVLDTARSLVQQQVSKLGGSCETIVEKPPVIASPIIQDATLIACDKLNLSRLTMSSGAGHDAMNMGLLCPTGIFFVPSMAGISHSKDEFTTAEDCLNGAQVYLESVIALDALLA